MHLDLFASSHKERLNYPSKKFRKGKERILRRDAGTVSAAACIRFTEEFQNYKGIENNSITSVFEISEQG